MASTFLCSRAFGRASTRSILGSALVALLLSAAACGGDDSGKSGSDAGTSTGGNVAANAVGKACTTDTDCGKGTTCATTQSFGTLSALLGLLGATDLKAPGGYCTNTSCSSDSDCGTGGVCLGAAAGIFKGECRQACASNTDCRDGYECAMETVTDAGTTGGLSGLVKLPSQCQAKPTPNVLTGKQAGAACTTPTDGGVATECGMGFCAANTCTGICNDNSTCGTGGACVPNGYYGNVGTCQEGCSADTDCQQFKANSTVGCTDGKVCGTKAFPLAAGAVGKACTADAVCGSTGQCAQALGIAQTAAPDGYCTGYCTDSTTCGGGTCVAATCFATCTSDDGCRSGYACTSVRVSGNTTVSFCAPSGTVTTAPDAGTKPAADAGVPAAADAGSDAS